MASPVFDLAVDGIVYFARFGRVLSQRKIRRDPLNGIADSSNKLFFTNFYPVLTSGSVGVYVSGSQVGGTADYDSGEVTLTSAPSTQPEATYTFTPYTATQVLQFVIAGFDEMETRWSRELKLVNASGAAANEDSANIYVADDDGNEPVSPSASSITFSSQRAQIAFLMACTEYRYLLSQLGEAAIGDFMWRESLRGMTVDKSRRPGNLQLAIAETDKRVIRTMKVAQDVWYSDGTHLGAYQPAPVTLEYANTLEWQTASRDQNNRSQLGYHISFRPLTSYP